MKDIKSSYPSSIVKWSLFMVKNVVYWFIKHKKSSITSLTLSKIMYISKFIVNKSSANITCYKDLK